MPEQLCLEVLLETAKASGWHVSERRPTTAAVLPDSVAARYPVIPNELRAFLERVDALVSPDEKTWFLCSSDYAGESDSAFAWNEFETMSLDAADGDGALLEEVCHFWDGHMPVALSVADGYAFYSVRIADGAVVFGREPEFEASAKEVERTFGALVRTLVLRQSNDTGGTSV